MNIYNIKNVKKRNIMLLTIITIFALSLISFEDEDIFHYMVQTIVQNKEIPINSQKISINKYYIYVDLDKKQLSLYQGDKIIKVYPISGGKPSTPSPLGNWTIISKAKWGEGFGGGWLGFNVPWGKYGIHGTIYPWLIGQNSSKGCIRMNNKDLRKLYKLVPIGTQAEIVHRNPIRRDLEHGDIGADVLIIQSKLKELHYYNGGLDGMFGSQLKNAVIKYQKEKGIRQTGIVGTKTFIALLKEIENWNS